MNKTLPIGNDDFRDIRENGMYYVDKTMMVKDFIEYKDKVALVTRPRRFGKTLGMTMQDTTIFLKGRLILRIRITGGFTRHLKYWITEN